MHKGASMKLDDIITQILEDVEDAQKTGDLELFYERMLANVEDLKRSRES